MTAPIRGLDRTDQSDLTDLTDHERWALYAPWLEHADPAVRANALICLINQASYLLGRQLQRLEQDFLKEGGFTERLHKQRQAARDASRKGKPHGT